MGRIQAPFVVAQNVVPGPVEGAAHIPPIRLRKRRAADLGILALQIRLQAVGFFEGRLDGLTSLGGQFLDGLLVLFLGDPHQALDLVFELRSGGFAGGRQSVHGGLSILHLLEGTQRAGDLLHVVGVGFEEFLRLLVPVGDALEIVHFILDIFHLIEDLLDIPVGLIARHPAELPLDPFELALRGVHELLAVGVVVSGGGRRQRHHGQKRHEPGDPFALHLISPSHRSTGISVASEPDFALRFRPPRVSQYWRTRSGLAPNSRASARVGKGSLPGVNSRKGA